MLRHGATAFVYGHDHVFSRQMADGIHYICGGKPNTLDPRWWDVEEWKRAYPEFTAAPGYMRWRIRGAKGIDVEYVRSAHDEAETIKAGKPGEVLEKFTILPRA
jgi:hypothetical protein